MQEFLDLCVSLFGFMLCCWCIAYMGVLTVVLEMECWGGFRSLPDVLGL